MCNTEKGFYNGASSPLSHADKIAWMHKWCSDNGAVLTLEGECGYGRECVGILIEDTYPDYNWYDEKTWERIDNNGDVWAPPNAYHKHPCVAVLGRGESAEAELYEWVKWFDNNGFKPASGNVLGVRDMLRVMLGQHRFHRMVKGA